MVEDVKVCLGLYKVLMERLEGKRSLGRPRRTLVDNIKMDLREVRGVDLANWPPAFTEIHHRG